jgi:hypothetical protein
MKQRAPTPHTPALSATSRDVERIKLDLLDAYERAGTVDIAFWTARFPDHRAELVDYWMWLRGTQRLSEMDQSPGPDSSDQGEGAEIVRRACLSVSLGPQWLERLADPDAATEERLGVELEQLRATPQASPFRASKAFRRATVYSWTVAVLTEGRGSVSRFTVQKVTYLLEHSLKLELFNEHARKPFGPYDHKARYRDAEPIAEKKGWIRIDGKRLMLGGHASGIGRYATRYVRSPELAKRLLDVLGVLPDPDLETLATVLWAARAQASHTLATASSIRTYLAGTPEWCGKLGRSNFSDEQITRALSHLSRLRLFA